ncbi:rhombosortase [Thalassotalea profundi]|uniref:Rhombosortase n=1 Tax=Thalassotalea profundi TaxID=2036687 RepID=A0ABQ3J6G3_9GAMM|nr:rhombosortase [Thalassotalea profundi]GHF01878.1 rhombosortase [Thalassotalea profundi]
MIILKKLPINKSHLVAPLLIVIIALTAFFFNNDVSGHLSYNRELIYQGQWWLLFTGHLLHTNDMHLAMNSAAVILLWALHGQFFTFKSYVAIWLLIALGTSLGLYLFSPSMLSYVGLSGVLHGFFVIGACKDIQHKEKTGYLLLVAVIIKVAYEQVFGPSEEVIQLIEANVAIDAHLYGLIGGFIVFSALYCLQLKSDKVSNSIK